MKDKDIFTSLAELDAVSVLENMPKIVESLREMLIMHGGVKADAPPEPVKPPRRFLVTIRTTTDNNYLVTSETEDNARAEAWDRHIGNGAKYNEQMVNASTVCVKIDD